MVVHEMGSGQNLFEIVEPQMQWDGHSNGAPQRVPSPDPVPELEHVLLVDPEGLDLLGVGGQRDEMFGNVGILKRSKQTINYSRGRHVLYF